MVGTGMVHRVLTSPFSSSAKCLLLYSASEVAMATTTQLSLEDYLQTSFSPDVEYVDGELKARNMGSYEHARLRLLVGAWFAQMEK